MRVQEYIGPQTEVITLEQNYRSSAHILSVGSAFLHGSSQRVDKTLQPTKPVGEPVRIYRCHDKKLQARFIATDIKWRREQEKAKWSDFACLFRNFKMGSHGKLHMELQEALTSHQIPYVIHGDKFILDKKEVQVVVMYLRLARSSSDDEAFAKVVDIPPRGLPEKKVVEALRQARNAAPRTFRGGLGKTTSMLLEEKADAGLSKRQKKNLRTFFDLLDRLRRQAVNSRPVDLISWIWGLGQVLGSIGRK